MLDIWNQSFYVFLVRVGAAILLYTFSFLFASVFSLLFSDKDQGCSPFKRKLTCLHTMNAKQKNNKNSMVYRITFSSDIKKRHQHPHGLRGGSKCQISKSAKF